MALHWSSYQGYTCNFMIRYDSVQWLNNFSSYDLFGSEMSLCARRNWQFPVLGIHLSSVHIKSKVGSPPCKRKNCNVRVSPTRERVLFDQWSIRSFERRPLLLREITRNRRTWKLNDKRASIITVLYEARFSSLRARRWNSAPDLYCKSARSLSPSARG